MKILHISRQVYDQLKSIFNGEYDVIVFGSRVSGNHDLYSDIDICLKAKNKVPFSEIGDLREKCQKSSIPYVVDIIDYHQISEGFRSIIDSSGVLLTESHPSDDSDSNTDASSSF